MIPLGWSSRLKDASDRKSERTMLLTFEAMPSMPSLEDVAKIRLCANMALAACAGMFWTMGDPEWMVDESRPFESVAVHGRIWRCGSQINAVVSTEVGMSGSELEGSVSGDVWRWSCS